MTERLKRFKDAVLRLSKAVAALYAPPTDEASLWCYDGLCHHVVAMGVVE